MKHSVTLSSPISVHKRLHPLPLRDSQSSKTDPLDIGLPKEKRLLTIPETASLLQVSLTTVRNMIDSGSLEAGPVNTNANPLRFHLRITRESVERFQKERFGR